MQQVLWLLAILGLVGCGEATSDYPRDGVGVVGGTGGTGASPATGGTGGLEESCPAFSPCGGDPTGTFTIESICAINGWESVASQSIDEPECQDVFTDVQASMTGTMTVASDATYTMLGTLYMTMHAVWSSPCLSAMAGRALTAAEVQTFCDELQTRIETDPTAPFDSGSCALVAGVCECDFAQSGAVTDAGTVDIASGTFLEADGGIEPYCMQGDVLYLQDTSDEGDIAVVTLRRTAP